MPTFVRLLFSFRSTPKLPEWSRKIGCTIRYVHCISLFLCMSRFPQGPRILLPRRLNYRWKSGFMIKLYMYTVSVYS